jgi:hypothetical protein
LTVAKVRITGATPGSIMPTIITHHIANSRSSSVVPRGGMAMARSMPVIAPLMSAAARKR